MIKRLLFFGTPLGGLLLVAALFGANILSYQRLSGEQEIAQLTFEPVADNRWTAYVADGQGCALTVVELVGDQWRIDAEFLKWKPWANLLGLDAQYRLSRIEGRFADIDAQNTNDSPAWSLTPQNTLDISALGKAMGRLNFMLDSRYGSSVYQSIEQGLIYRVYRTQSGLITRYRPRGEDVKLGESEMSIRIRKGCDSEPSLMQSAALQLDGWIQGAAGR